MITNPVKAIRQKCLDCSCGQINEVRECTVERCALYPFRFGKNPYRTKRVLTEEQRRAASQRMKALTERQRLERERGEHNAQQTEDTV